jgi:hypothetical protein
MRCADVTQSHMVPEMSDSTRMVLGREEQDESREIKESSSTEQCSPHSFHLLLVFYVLSSWLHYHTSFIFLFIHFIRSSRTLVGEEYSYLGNLRHKFRLIPSSLPPQQERSIKRWKSAGTCPYLFQLADFNTNPNVCYWNWSSLGCEVREMNI